MIGRPSSGKVFTNLIAWFCLRKCLFHCISLHFFSVCWAKFVIFLYFENCFSVCLSVYLSLSLSLSLSIRTSPYCLCFVSVFFIFGTKSFQFLLLRVGVARGWWNYAAPRVHCHNLKNGHIRHPDADMLTYPQAVVSHDGRLTYL